MSVTLDQIETIEFKFVAKGYDPQEVDDLLNDIMDTMEDQENQLKSLQQQLATAKAQAAAPTQVIRPVAAPQAESAGNEQVVAMLEMAAKVKAETLAKAEADAKDILAKAQADADAQLRGLADERDRLTREVNNLRLVASEYRSKFESLLQAQQEAIEKASELF